MRYIIIKNLILFVTGFCLYMTIECCFRGYSFPLMGLCGGICVVVLDKINDEISWDLDLMWQATYGTILITAMELVIGYIAKYTDIIPVMWNYSSVPFNIDGIICLPFSIAWFFLSIAAIFVADAINYYVLDDKTVPYYYLFNKKFMIRFHEKQV